MANRYWVGGTGNWSDTAQWSTTSGGTSGAAVPTTADDVFVDSNSGFGAGGALTLDGLVTQQCHDFTATSGHAYTLGGGNPLNIYGSAVFEADLAIESGVNILFRSNSAGETITTNTSPFYTINFYGTGDWTLQDDVVATGAFYMENGTLDANNKNITANDYYFYADTGFTPSIVMGSGTWTATGGDFYLDENSGEVLGVTQGTSTVKMTANGFFSGKGHTFYNLWLSGVHTFSVDGNNTFNDLKIDAGATVKFKSTQTQTVSSFTATGSVGNLITLTFFPGDSGQHFLSKSSGNVICDYLDLSNSNAGGGAAWYAGSHSNDTTNNTGWIFSDLTTTSTSSTSSSSTSSTSTSTTSTSTSSTSSSSSTSSTSSSSSTSTTSSSTSSTSSSSSTSSTSSSSSSSSTSSTSSSSTSTTSSSTSSTSSSSSTSSTSSSSSTSSTSSSSSSSTSTTSSSSSTSTTSTSTSSTSSSTSSTSSSSSSSSTSTTSSSTSSTSSSSSSTILLKPTIDAILEQHPEYSTVSYI